MSAEERPATLAAALVRAQGTVAPAPALPREERQTVAPREQVPAGPVYSTGPDTRPAPEPSPARAEPYPIGHAAPRGVGAPASLAMSPAEAQRIVDRGLREQHGTPANVAARHREATAPPEPDRFPLDLAVLALARAPSIAQVAFVATQAYGALTGGDLARLRIAVAERHAEILSTVAKGSPEQAAMLALLTPDEQAAAKNAHQRAVKQ